MQGIYILIIIIVIILVISFIYSYNNIDITKYIINNKKIDKDISIIFLSDLHNRDISIKLVNIINNIKPDIIIFGGDMINDGNIDYDNFIKLYNLLKEYKLYYTFGNHEERITEEEKELYNNILNKTNIILVNNKTQRITNNINLIGLDNDIETYVKYGRKGLDQKYIKNKIGKIDTKKYNIMLAHNPLEFDSYVKTKVDLVLSGHIHGGLIRLFKRGLLSPNITLFPKYDSGEYNKNNTKMIVSRGIGYSKRIKIRLFNPAEVVLIKLNSKL